MSDKAHATASLTTGAVERKEFEPGPALRREVRASFIRRTEPPRTLHGWCRIQKPPVPWSSANAALLGAYESAELLALRERILKAAGLVPANEES